MSTTPSATTTPQDSDAQHADTLPGAQEMIERVGDVMENAQELQQRAKEQLEQANHLAVTFIQDKPLIALGVALGAGYLLGSLAARRWII